MQYPEGYYIIMEKRGYVMRFLIQRVTDADVTVEGKSCGAIGRGFLVFIGIEDSDTTETADRLIKKMTGLRIFEDENGKTNRSLSDVDGSLLLVSQFTLYADCRKGNRPSFTRAGKPDDAEKMYEYITSSCKKLVKNVQTGIFGADMKVKLTNDGPFTVILDSVDFT